MGRDYEQGPWKKLFPYFHYCAEEANGTEPYIIHGNSDSNL